MSDEKTKEGVITMCVSNGLFFIGRLVSGGPKLLQPRMFSIFDEQEVDAKGNLIYDQNGQPVMVEKIGMRAFPGVPPFINIGTGCITYPVVSNIQNLLTLYAQVTSGQMKKVEPPLRPGEVRPPVSPGLSLVGQQNPPEVGPPAVEEKPLMGPRKINETDPKLN